MKRARLRCVLLFLGAGPAWVALPMASFGLTACSHAPSPSTPNGYTDGGATTIEAGLVTGLQQVVQHAQTYSSVPTDPKTSKAAAQIAELEFDRESQLGAANMLKASESDPKYAGSVAELEAYRQTALAAAADDLKKIQAVQKSSVPGSSQLALDGGAHGVVNSIIANAFAARAQEILNAGAAAATGTKGATAPIAEQISMFLQEAEVVTADEGAGGHDVAARLIARGLLSDAGLTTNDAGAP